MLAALSELTGAIAGPNGGIGDLQPYNASNGLLCTIGVSPSDPLVSLPVYHSQPTFIDVHSQKAYPMSVADTGTWAKTFYSSLWSYMVYRGRTNDLVVFGETNPVDILCSPSSAAQAEAAMRGVLGQTGGYKGSSLYANRAYNVIMRPWHRTEYGLTCTPSPHIINPPFNPFF